MGVTGGEVGAQHCGRVGGVCFDVMYETDDGVDRADGEPCGVVVDDRVVGAVLLVIETEGGCRAVL